MCRNVTSVRPKFSKNIFRKVPKFSNMLVPLDVALFYLQELYGDKEIPATLTEKEVQIKLDRAYAMGDSPWHVLVG